MIYRKQILKARRSIFNTFEFTSNITTRDSDLQ